MRGKLTLPLDDRGLVGRQCPAPDCGLYFKLKPGTGLPVQDCGCPYCGTRAAPGEFLTADQREYAKSIVAQQVLGPMLADFKRNVERQNQPAGRSLLSIRVSVTVPDFPTHLYQEAELETDVTCDHCALEFAVYGVFASCPDCGQLNVFQAFRTSLAVCRRRLALLDLDATQADPAIGKAIVRDALGQAVASFDGLGKKLRMLRPAVFPKQPKNLFQNLAALDACLTTAYGYGIEARLGGTGRDALVRLVQVRHLYEHNMGVVDDEFVTKVPTAALLRGRLYPIARGDVEQLIGLLDQLSVSLEHDVDPLP